MMLCLRYVIEKFYFCFNEKALKQFDIIYISCLLIPCHQHKPFYLYFHLRNVWVGKYKIINYSRHSNGNLKKKTRMNLHVRVQKFQGIYILKLKGLKERFYRNVVDSSFQLNRYLLLLFSEQQITMVEWSI